MIRALEPRFVPGLPAGDVMRDTIDEGASVAPRRALDGPCDADELNVQRIRRRAHHRVAVPAEVREGEMRRDIRIARRERLRCIVGLP